MSCGKCVPALCVSQVVLGPFWGLLLPSCSSLFVLDSPFTMAFTRSATAGLSVRTKATAMPNYHLAPRTILILRINVCSPQRCCSSGTRRRARRSTRWRWRGCCSCGCWRRPPCRAARSPALPSTAPSPPSCAPLSPAGVTAMRTAAAVTLHLHLSKGFRQGPSKTSSVVKCVL